MIRLMKHTLALLLLFAFVASVIGGSTAARRVEAAVNQNAAIDNSTTAANSVDWRITGPTGGDVRALVVDPNDPQRFYFGTLDGQIYTSTDGGQNWRLLYNFRRPRLFIDNIIVDPRNSQTLYVAAHRHTEAGGFFKTTDGGKTWRENQEMKKEALHSITQSSSNPDVLIVGTNNGVFRSEDAGETWKQISQNIKNVESLGVDPRNTDVIYAGTWYLPYKTTDGGKSWRTIKTGMIDDSDVFAIDIDPSNPDHIIASACSGIYDSRNAGENWRKVQGIPSQSRRTRAIMQHPSNPDLVFAGTTEGFWRSAKGGNDGSWMLTTSKQLEINSIAVHPKNPDVIFIGTNNYGVMVSRDGGRTFTPSNGGYSGRFANALAPDRERPGRIYASTINTATGGGFFFISEDSGGSWQPAMRNMPPRLITYSILQDERDGNVIYLGTNLGVYRSLDRGASWAPIGAPATPRQSSPRSRRRGGRTRSTTSLRAATAAAGSSSGMTKSAQEALNAAGYDAGPADGAAGTRTIAALRKFQADKKIPVTGKFDATTLTALGLGGGTQATTKSGKLAQPPVAISESVNALVPVYAGEGAEAGLLAATNAGLYLTSDPTKGWQKISYGGSFDPRTTAVATTPQDPKLIWVGTATSGLLVSRDGGETWQQVEGVSTKVPISAIKQDPQRTTHVYVGTKQTFWFSHDGGEKWTRRGGNLPLGDYSSILINPKNTDELFVGNAYQNNDGSYWDNTGGVYRSTDAGMTWRRVDARDASLPSRRVWALALDLRDPNRIFVGTHSAGVYVAERGGESTADSTK